MFAVSIDISVVFNTKYVANDYTNALAEDTHTPIFILCLDKFMQSVVPLEADEIKLCA